MFPLRSVWEKRSLPVPLAAKVYLASASHGIRLLIRAGSVKNKWPIVNHSTLTWGQQRPPMGGWCQEQSRKCSWKVKETRFSLPQRCLGVSVSVTRFWLKKTLILFLHSWYIIQVCTVLVQNVVRLGVKLNYGKT